jgi:hypothetical protein
VSRIHPATADGTPDGAPAQDGAVHLRGAGLSRILDEALGAAWPKSAHLPEDDRYVHRRTPRRRGTWMTA